MASKSKPETLTADAVADLFAAPERAQRAAAAQAVIEKRGPALARLREALEVRLAVLEPLHGEVARWFRARPVVERAVFEEALGAHATELLDRLVLLARQLEDLTGGPGPVAARQALEQLADPADDGAFAAALAALRDLEEKESLAVHRAGAWRRLRASTIEQLRAAVTLTERQMAWVEGDHVGD